MMSVGLWLKHISCSKVSFFLDFGYVWYFMFSLFNFLPHRNSNIIIKRIQSQENRRIRTRKLFLSRPKRISLLWADIGDTTLRHSTETRNRRGAVIFELVQSWEKIKNNNKVIKEAIMKKESWFWFI